MKEICLSLDASLNIYEDKLNSIYINEDFSKETLEIRKQNWDRVTVLCKQGKCAILVYDCIYTR